MSGDAAAWTLIEIATSGGEYLRFAPYVASIDEDGRVAFQAEMRSGESRIIVGGKVVKKGQEGEWASSHPALSRKGLSYYATHNDASVLIRPGQKTLGSSVGPLGPTINDSGVVAYRGMSDGGACVCIARDDREILIANEASGYTNFEGLPDINNKGEVVFRADRAGVAGLYRYCDGEIHTIAELGSTWKTLWAFPHNDEVAVGFVGSLETGVSGLFRESQGDIQCLLDTKSVFHSFRGLLLAGEISIFYGTPRGEGMGIFSLRSGVIEPILSVGDLWQGATIEAFALNPVSINANAQLAIRIQLSDKRECILRAQL